MSTLYENWEAVEVEEPVHIPTLDGKAIAETVRVKVKGYRNPADGEIYFDQKTLEHLDKVKARKMGLMLPKEIRELRESLDLTQKELSDLLQIGEKTYTRWETGRERPSRSMNILLRALRDGRIDIPYLRAIRVGKFDWRTVSGRVSHLESLTELLRDCFAETRTCFLSFTEVPALLFTAQQKAIDRRPRPVMHGRRSFEHGDPAALARFEQTGKLALGEAPTEPLIW
jgi:putative zinc finger/helix-turn-helix YgiT family protein